MNELHDTFMYIALQQAKKALAAQEVPIGAVVVDGNGVILARAFNTVERQKYQGAHAEMRAIAKACKKKGDWRLSDCWLYVTLEPCAMCMHLSILSRLRGLVYGAASPVFGYHLDNELSFQLYKKRALEIIPGVQAAQAAQLLKHFFTIKRKRSRE